MFNNLKADFKRSEKEARIVLMFFRGGHYWYKKGRLIKWFWKILNNLFCKIPWGIVLPIETEIGAGLRLVHLDGIVIHPNAKIGKNCTIFQQVTIGNLEKIERGGVPTIGNNVYIGAGAKLIGSILVGDNVKIGANAVVTKDIPPGATCVEVNKIIIKE